MKSWAIETAGMEIDGVWYDGRRTIGPEVRRFVEHLAITHPKANARTWETMRVRHSRGGSMTTVGGVTRTSAGGCYPGRLFDNVVVFSFAELPPVTIVLPGADSNLRTWLEWKFESKQLSVFLTCDRTGPRLRHADSTGGVKDYALRLPDFTARNLRSSTAGVRTLGDVVSEELSPMRLAWGAEPFPAVDVLDEMRFAQDLGAAGYIRWAPSRSDGPYEGDPRKLQQASRMRDVGIPFGCLINPRQYPSLAVTAAIADWMKHRGMTLAFWDMGGFIDEQFNVDWTMSVLEFFGTRGIRVLVESGCDFIARAMGTAFTFPFERGMRGDVLAVDRQVRLCTSWHGDGHETWDGWWREAESAGFVPVMRLEELAADAGLHYPTWHAKHATKWQREIESQQPAGGGTKQSEVTSG